MAYIYKGSQSWLELKDSKGKTVFAGQIIPGRSYELPADDLQVQAMLASGRLAPQPSARADRQEKKGAKNG